MWLQAETGNLVNLAAIHALTVVVCPDGSNGTGYQLLACTGPGVAYRIARGPRAWCEEILDVLGSHLDGDQGVLRFEAIRPRPRPEAVPPLDQPDGGRRAD